MKFVLTVLFSTCVLEATEVAHCKMNLKCLFVNENPGKTTRVLSRTLLEIFFYIVGENWFRIRCRTVPPRTKTSREHDSQKKFVQKWS